MTLVHFLTLLYVSFSKVYTRTSPNVSSLILGRWILEITDAVSLAFELSSSRFNFSVSDFEFPGRYRPVTIRRMTLLPHCVSFPRSVDVTPGERRSRLIIRWISILLWGSTVLFFVMTLFIKFLILMSWNVKFLSYFRRMESQPG